jgi:hypothetical protein
VQIPIRAPDELRRNVAEARALSGDRLAQLRALYAIISEGQIKCVTPTACCNHSFTIQLHYLVLGSTYGEMLWDSTADLQGEERAKAIGRGLEGIKLYSNGSIGRLVKERMPELAGKEAAKRYLPARYAEWLD